MKEIVKDGEVYIKKSDLNYRDKTQIKLLELLENVDKNAATPDVLEAAAKIGKVLLEF